MVEQFMYSLCPLTKLFNFFLTKNSHRTNCCKIKNSKYKCCELIFLLILADFQKRLSELVMLFVCLMFKMAPVFSAL
jgi:hypothetical protein